MALQTSGQISLNDIHVEAGGSSGTACTINDSDIRGLIGGASGAARDFADFYGASATPSVSAGTAITLVSDGVITSGYADHFVSVQTGTTTLPPSPSENRTWAYKYTVNMNGTIYITGNGQATGSMVSGNDRAIYILRNGTQIAAAGSSINTNNVATVSSQATAADDLFQYDIRDVYWRYSAGGVRAIDCDIKKA